MTTTTNATNTTPTNASTPYTSPCHWNGCKSLTKPGNWACFKHWNKLPEAIKHKLWCHYTPPPTQTTQPKPKPSQAYLEVALEADLWIANFDPPRPDPDRTQTKGISAVNPNANTSTNTNFYTPTTPTITATTRYSKRVRTHKSDPRHPERDPSTVTIWDGLV
jgi:hypothetical protein